MAPIAEESIILTFFPLEDLIITSLSKPLYVKKKCKRWALFEKIGKRSQVGQINAKKCG